MELTSGKTAVVTGAASGIGFALAERFARAGLDIVLADIEQEALDAAEQKIAALGVQTLAVRTDVSDEAAVQALAAAATERFGAGTWFVTTPGWRAALTPGWARSPRGSGCSV